MELKRQFTFSGTFKKFHEEDIKPIEIYNASIYCYINGTVLIEVGCEINQHINSKVFYNSCPIYRPKNLPDDKLDILSILQLDSFEKELVQQPYEGDYEIEGKTVEGWQIQAIVRDTNFKVGNSEKVEKEQKHQIGLRDLCIDYNPDLQKEGKIQEISYGLANIEIINSFSTKISNLEAEIYFVPVATRINKNISGTLSAEMKLRNIYEDKPDSYETYSSWLTSLLSLASGNCIEQIYRIKTVRCKELHMKSEYWSGRGLRDEGREIEVIQSPQLYPFIQQCAAKLTKEIFSEEGTGLGLALSWYISTFVSTVAEVNFLLLCTVLESLNKKYSKNASKRLISKQKYKKIREKILEIISESKRDIDNETELTSYKIFEIKVRKYFEDASCNQVGSLRNSLKEMFKSYNVPYEDLFPDLEFIKVRDDIVHEGFGKIDVDVEHRKLSNLVVRVFLAILGYQGDYMESTKIEMDDKFGQNRHGLICRSFPLAISDVGKLQTPDY